MQLRTASTFPVSTSLLGVGLICTTTTLVALLGGLALMPAHAPESPTAVFVLMLLFVYLNLLIFGETQRADLRPISILLWVYLGYFLVLPGVAQVWDNTYPWDGGLFYDRTTVLISAFLVLCFCVSYIFGQRVSRRTLRDHQAAPVSIPLENTTIVLFCGAAILIAIYAVAVFGPDFFLASRYEDNLLGAANPGGHVNSFNDILPVIAQAVIFAAFTLVVFLYLRVRHTSDDGQRIVVFCLALLVIPLQVVVNNPLRISRFWLFGMIIAFLLAFCPPKTRRARFWSVVAFIAGTFVIFPLANLTRAEDYSSFEMPTASQFLLTPDLDGFQSLLSLVSYTQHVGFTYGKQILTVLLFFVPRAIWPGKGEDTGSMVADYAGYVINNISCPIVGELYIDFSVVGLIAGAFAIGYFAARAEALYARALAIGELSVTRLLVASIGGFTVILARGTLGGIIAPVISGVLPYAAILIAGRLLKHGLQIGSRRSVTTD